MHKRGHIHVLTVLCKHTSVYANHRHTQRRNMYKVKDLADSVGTDH